jgi:hypothetical protein
MSGKHLMLACLAAALLAAAPPRHASASGPAPKETVTRSELEALKQNVRDLKATVETQAGLIKELQNQPHLEPLISAPYPGAGGPPVPLSSAPAPSPVPSAPAGTPVTGFSALNPEIGVVGDVVGTASTENAGIEGADQFTFRELEFVFGGYLDPYSRGDFALVVHGDEGIEIEEAFLTHFNLPFALKGQIGKFRSKFGKINLTDLNALPSVNEPLVIQDLLGHEGFSHTGVRLQRLIPNPWDFFLEGTLEFVNGEEGGEGHDAGRVFRAGRDKPILVSHLKSYFDLTDDTGLELGGSLMVGPSQRSGRMLAHIVGADLTLTHYMEEGRKLVWQSEFMHATRKRNNDISLADVFGVDDTDALTEILNDLDPQSLAETMAELEIARRASSTDAWGGYSMVDFRFHPQWSVGGRADYIRPLDEILTGNRAWAAAGWLTFHQSEFARVRLQYQHSEFGKPFFMHALRDAHRDEVMLQVRFQIGVDRHGLQ